MIDIEPPAVEGEDGAPVKHGSIVERTLIVVISLAMIVLPVLEIILRAIRGSGVPGSSVYVQHLTLWLGFLGALATTDAGRHLGLATTHFLKEGRRKTAALVFGDVFSAVTCMMLSYASYLVVNANRDSPTRLNGNIPEWWSQLIVPVTLGAIALRFVWKTPGKWIGRGLNLAVCIGMALVFRKMGADQSHALFWPLTVVSIVAFILGVPVFAALGALAMLFFFNEDSTIASVPEATLQLVQTSALPAIPLLTLAGYILAAGGASSRMVRAYKSLFGWLPGGVGLMVIFVCAAFTTFTGGSGVTILALGGLLYPALIKDRYPEGFSLGLVTASGSLGLLFPPSLPVILYGAVAGVAPDKLFLGGLVPGILLMLVVGAYTIRAGIASHVPKQPFDAKEVRAALWAAKWDLGLPLIVLAVILSGRGLIVEASALGAAYALAVELIVFRDVHPLKEMPRVIVQSASLVGAVVILMGAAFGLHAYLVDVQALEALVTWVVGHIHQQWLFLLALNGILLVLGSVFEIYAAIITLAPLVVPLGVAFGVEPVHLGVVFLANLELGFLFPPMGLNLFLSASRFNKPLPYVYKHTLPFLVILAVGVLLITYLPAITTGVVALFGHGAQ